MTELYHAVPQAFRIQKRLVLNRCFKLVRDRVTSFAKLTYVTFGGGDLYDVMDLLCVFDIGSLELNVVSYEMDEEIARTAQRCAVTKTLNKVKTVSIEIMPIDFPSGIERYSRAKSMNTFVYFLDYTKTFSDGERQAIAQLLAADMLRAGDYLLVTSCLTPRVVHQARFMDAYRSSFSIFFGGGSPSRDFKVRNHVDLFLGLVSSDFEKQRAWSSKSNVRFELLGKLRYNDTRAPMGVWVYAVQPSDRTLTHLPDRDFELFPKDFVYKKPKDDVINIFDD